MTIPGSLSAAAPILNPESEVGGIVLVLVVVLALDLWAWSVPETVDRCKVRAEQ
jgi:hypothetical protein